MAIEVEKLVWQAQAELDSFERDMKRIPEITEDVSRKAQQKAAKYAQANAIIQRNFADAGVREQKRLTNEVLREIDRRNKAEAQAANKRKSFGGSSFLGSFGGNLAANAVSSFGSQIKDMAVEGVRLNATLDRLVRFTATLDKNFQTPVNLLKFKNDIIGLSKEIPHSAQRIAEASFSVKSAFSNLDEPQTIEFLRQFGLAATASNADIADFTKNTIALAKVFKVEMKDLPTFMAKVNATFKDGLASDSEIAQGYNKTVTSIQTLKLSMNDYLSLMSVVQGSTADAAGAVTNLQSLFAKLNDAKYIEGLKDFFNIKRFTKEGGLKSVPEIINEISKSLEGLTDEQKITKINSVFKDLEANKAITTVLANIDQLNSKLKDTSSAEAFKSTQDLMLGSVESRWTTFWNNITADQTGAGSKITDFFLSAFDSTTVEGGIAIFFGNLSGAIMKGTADFVFGIANVGRDIGDWILSGFLDEKQIADQRAKFDSLNKSIYDGITWLTDSSSRSILENQKKYWQKIADSTADSDAKQKALSNVQSLTKSIQQIVDASALATYQSWEKIGKQAVDGLKSSEPAVKAQAEKTIIETLKGLQSAINDNKNSAAMKQSFADLFKKLSDSVTSGELKQKIKEQFGEFPNQIANTINAGKPQMQSAVSNLLQINTNVPNASGDLIGKNFVVSVNQAINSGKNQITATQNNLFGQANTGYVTSSGFRIGTSLWQGIVQGLNSGHDNVAAASSSLINTADKYARLTAKSHSPSELFAEIGGDLGDGLAVGIERKQKKIKDTLQKTITKQAKDLQKELKESLNEFEASLAGFSKTSQIRSELFKVGEQQSLFDDIIRLRNELGINVDKPLIAGSLEKEKNQLEQIEDRLSNLKSTVQSFRDALPKDNLQSFFDKMKFLQEDSTSDGFRKTAESMGLTVEQLKEFSKMAFTADFITGLDKANEEFEQMSSETVTEGLRARTEAVKRMVEAYEGLPDDQQQEFANSFGIRVPKVNIDSEPPPEFKKKQAKIEFDTIASFFDRSFTDLRERGWRGMLEGMVIDFNDALQEMFVKWVTSSIFKAFNQPLPENSSGGGGGSIGSKLLNWGINALIGAFGGSFTKSFTSALNYSTPLTNTIGSVAVPTTFRPLVSLPGRASGGNVFAGKDYLVGEQGWEIYRPANNGQIFNQKQIAPNYNFGSSFAQNSAQMRTGGNQTINNENHYHFHGDPKTGNFNRASATQEMKRLMDAQRREQQRR